MHVSHIMMPVADDANPPPPEGGLVPGIGLRQLGGDDMLRALVVTGHTDIHHDWRTMSPMLAQLLRDSGRFDVRITEEFRGGGPETLEPTTSSSSTTSGGSSRRGTLPSSAGAPAPSRR